MGGRFALLFTALFFSSPNFAGVQNYYCPQHAGYINLGMTPEQVIAACGQPLSKQAATQPIMQRVPVRQLIYNSQGADKVFYGVWAIPTGVNTGAKLTVDIVDNKVYAANLNGSSTNAFSICNGANIQIGDPAAKVYGSCGNPSLVNNTYINQPVESNHRPEIWTFQPDEYQQPINLTFVNGKLQSIE